MPVEASLRVCNHTVVFGEVDFGEAVRVDDDGIPEMVGIRGFGGAGAAPVAGASVSIAGAIFFRGLVPLVVKIEIKTVAGVEGQGCRCDKGGYCSEYSGGLHNHKCKKHSGVIQPRHPFRNTRNLPKYFI